MTETPDFTSYLDVWTSSGECNLQHWETKESVCFDAIKEMQTLLDGLPWESDWFDEKGFNEYKDQYTVQRENYPEDGWWITLELFKRNELPIEFIEKISQSNIIGEISQLEINKWDIIELEQEEPNQYNLIIWTKTYKIDLSEGTMININ